MDTALDRAHLAMQDAPDDDRARLGFFGRLADDQLYVLLRAEPTGEAIDPEVFAAEGGDYVLAFDREDRLAAFAARPVPYAALPGRVLAALLSERGLGLGLNLGAPSETLLPPDALAWLAQTLTFEAPGQALARPQGFHPPGSLPPGLVAALCDKLAQTPGVAAGAWLAGVSYAGGGRGHLLAFAGTAPEAEAALARAVSEALVFSGVEAGALDVTFLPAEDPALPLIQAAGLAIAIPAPPPDAAPAPPAPPGSDPSRPPRLR